MADFISPYGEHALKISVVVIPKKDWRARPRQPLFWYDTNYRIKSVKAAEYTFIVGVIPKEGLVGPTRQSFFGYDNDKDLKAQFPVTQLL